METAGETVADLVKNQDRDRYSSILYAPEDHREGLFALAAFEIELARIPTLASEPMPGEIRLQWWRDVIESGAAAAGAGNPVAEQLGAAIGRYSLPVAALADMIDARIFDLYSDPMPSQTDLEGYCGETFAAAIQLSLLVLDQDGAAAHAETSGHAGCALGIARLLLGLPYQRRRQQCYIPSEMLAASGLEPEKFVSGEIGEAHIRALGTMLSLGRQHYSDFCKQAAKIASKARPAYLPIATVPHIFNAVEKAGPSAFRAPPVVSPVKRQWAMLRRAIAGW
jgi:phytoene synthase